MARFCSKCGKQLSNTARFCAGCGAAVGSAPAVPKPTAPAMSGAKCASCGRTLTPGKRFCAGCGAAVGSAPARPSATPPAGLRETVAAAAAAPVAGLLAPGSVGAFTMEIPAGFAAVKAVSAAVGEAVGPVRVLLDGVKGFAGGFRAALKSPKLLIPSLIMAVMWIGLTLLPAIDIEPPAFLSWLTFAQGGLSGGVAGALGGVLGKGLLASTLTGLLARTGKRGGVKAPKLPEKGGFGPILLGVGLALIAYNFLTYDNSPQNSMAGIVGCVAALRSSRSGGFLNRMLTAFVAKLPGVKRAHAMATSMSKGMAAGFALGVPLSLTGIGGIGYLLGLIVCVAGLVLSFAGNSRRGAVAG